PRPGESVLTHLVAADNTDAALAHAGWLLVSYVEGDRPASVRRTLRILGGAQELLRSDLALIAAWANVALGHFAEGGRWLDRLSSLSGMDEAWAHALRSEVLKGKGTLLGYQGALREIDLAIAICADVQRLRTGDERAAAV